jgi:integrase
VRARIDDYQVLTPEEELQRTISDHDHACWQWIEINRAWNGNANRYRYPIAVHPLYFWLVLAEISSDLFLFAWLKLSALAVTLTVPFILPILQRPLLVSAATLNELKHLASKLPTARADLSPKNKCFLRQFDDPLVLQRLRALPAKLWFQARRDDNPNFRTLASAAPVSARGAGCHLDTQDPRPKEHALTYRDGLMISLLAAVPLRRRTLAALTLDLHLVRIGDGWLLDIPAVDTKTRRPLELPIPSALSEYMDHYLGNFRSAIAGANTHQGLWSSAKGRPMTGGAIYDAICRRTNDLLGFPVNLHHFRRAAGNLWSITDPKDVRGVKDLLGHADFGTTEKHYIGAQSRIAGRALAKVLRPSYGRFS